MDWAMKRRVTYAVTFFVVIFTILFYSFRNTIFPKATCFDGKKNGYESGVDCGGGCSLMCKDDVRPVAVLWTQFLKTSDYTYDLVAMLANKNIDSSPKFLDYSFDVFGINGEVLSNVKKQTMVPVSSEFPVVVQNFFSKVPLKSLNISLGDYPYYKTKEKPVSPSIKVMNTRFENGDISRVYINLLNNKVIPVRNVPIRVILFDQNQNAIASGEQIISLDAQGSKQVVFTWHINFAKDPEQIKVYPIINPFI